MSQLSPVRQPRIFRLEEDFLWPRINRTDETYTLYEHGSKKPYHIKPNDHYRFPKQRQFLRYTHDHEATLFGGAGGGGKSDIGHKSAYVHQIEWHAAGYTRDPDTGRHRVLNSAVVCKTEDEVWERHEALIEQMIPRWFGNYVKSKHYFQLSPALGGGRVFYANIADADSWKSREFGYMYLDELTQFPDPMQVEKVTSRLRSVVPGLLPSWGAGTNPDGVGNEWVFEMFVDEAKRQQPRFSERFKVWTRGYNFIPCLPEENPLISREWLANLELKPRAIREAILEGLWDISESMFFTMLDARVHQIKRFHIPPNTPIFIGVDHSTAHPTVCLVAAYFHPTKEYPRGRIIIVDEYSAVGQFASDHKKEIWRMLRGGRAIGRNGEKGVGWPGFMRSGYGVGDVRMKAFRGAVRGENTVWDVFNSDDVDKTGGPSLKLFPANDDRKDRAEAMSEALSFREVGGLWLEGKYQSGQITEPPVLQFFDDLPHVYSSIKRMKHDPKDWEVVEDTKRKVYGPGQGNDEYSACGYLVLELSSRIAMPEQEPAEYDYHNDPDYLPHIPSHLYPDTRSIKQYSGENHFMDGPFSNY